MEGKKEIINYEKAEGDNPSAFLYRRKKI